MKAESTVYTDIIYSSHCFPNLQNETTPMINESINLGAKFNMDSTT